MANKAIVLSSGGIDSTTALAFAIREYDTVTSVSVFYGQRHSKELEQAQKIAQHYGVEHIVLDLSGILQYSDNPLMAHSKKEIEHKSYAEQIAEHGEGMVSTYVPFRNGLMLSAVAALAQSLYPEENVRVFIGAHADDAAGQAYADCSAEFTEHMHKAINIGTYGKVSVTAPFVGLTKPDIVRIGLELDVPYHLTWSCYVGEEHPCGTCGTCIDRQAAFVKNGTVDPLSESTLNLTNKKTGEK